MRANEFVLIKNNIPCLNKAIAVLYDDENNRYFIVYDEGERKDNKTVLKLGEILLEDEEVIIEELIEQEDINGVWDKFMELYNNEFIGG